MQHARRSDYKALRPATASRQTTKTEESTRWQQRLFHKRLEDAHSLKRSQINARRTGLACYEEQEDDVEWTVEEESVLRRMANKERQQFYSDQHEQWYEEVGQTDYSDAELEQEPGMPLHPSRA